MANFFKSVFVVRLQDFRDILFEFFKKDKIGKVIIRGSKVIIEGDLYSREGVLGNPFAMIAKKAPNLRIHEVVGNITLTGGRFVDLRHFPEVVRGWLQCPDVGLKSLSGAPRYIGSLFNVDENNLSSLLGSPRHVEGNYAVDYNKLQSLDGISPYIGGSLFCCYNKLGSLEGLNSHVGGDLFCEGNPGSESFIKPFNVSGEMYNNE